MERIFIGMLLVFLDFTLSIGNSRIDLIPDFVGYILMMKGIMELIQGCEELDKARQFAMGMAIFTGAQFAMDLLGISVSIGWFTSYILAAGALAGELITAYWIIQGILRLQIIYNRNLEAENLLYIWKVRLAFSIAAYALSWVSFLAFIAIIGNLIVSIIYLGYFNKTKNLYYAL